LQATEIDSTYAQRQGLEEDGRGWAAGSQKEKVLCVQKESWADTGRNVRNYVFRKLGQLYFPKGSWIL
jgi:hypothetical protein